MASGRAEIVRAQLARTGVDWDKAVQELREALIGLATEIDAMDGRLKELEAEGRKAEDPRCRSRESGPVRPPASPTTQREVLVEFGV
jgi:hypothetical protein